MNCQQVCLLCIAALCVTSTVYHSRCSTAGGPFFDPLGFSRGDEQSYFEYKTKEVKNGRLAMLAFLGFFAQYAATGMHCSHCIIASCNISYSSILLVKLVLVVSSCTEVFAARTSC